MRKLMVVAVLLLALATVAGAQHTRAVAPPPMTMDPDAMMLGNNSGAISGTVTSVSGNVITLANGLIAIDATNAKIVGDRGAAATVSTIVPGALVTAVLASSTPNANGALPATLIALVHNSQVTLTGTVSAVDTVHSTLTIFGRTIQVNPQTSFSAPFFGSHVVGLADVHVNDIASVDANTSGATLVATSVHVSTTVQVSLVMLHGTVKSITSTAWVIGGRDKDFTAAINAETKIIGDPKVGDTVDALLRVEANNSYVAITIAKSLMPH